ncbi:MAG: PKD domain-containing protein [Bacteroidetes bacterium]|nr:MAG: PKD domain-containing protein [Bacteroidota bacterium]
MRRFIFPLLFFAFIIPGLSQTVVTLSGTVTDSATGLPIPNQAVQITSDSSGGFFYFNVVYTNQNGFYLDSIPLTGVSSGVLFVTTIDCNGFPVTYSLTFNPANMNLVQNFQICSGTPCEAGFSYVNTQPLTLQFTDISTGTTGPWLWQFGDGTSSSQQNPAHTYGQAGYFNVTLTIGDSSTSCWDMTAQTVYVSDTTGGSCVADFEYYPDSTGGYTIYFYDQSLGSISTWSWEFGDGQSASGQNPVHIYSQPGLYTVCLTVQGVDSLCYDTYCQVVNVGGSGGCQAQYTYYPDSSSNFTLIQFIDLSYGDITSWYWDFGDSTYSSEQNPSHLFPDEGTYYVCLTVTGNNAGVISQSTWCEEVVVGTGSDCASYFTFQNNGLSISFSGHMVNEQPATFSWDFGDGETGQGQNVIHQYPQSGIYYVTLTTVTQNPAGCTWSSAQSVAVGDSTQWNQLYGQVFTGNFPLELGIVLLFSLDTSATFVPFIDISVVDSFGIYYFPMVPLGNYLIYAIPITPVGYLPTYYGDALNWQNATVVSLGQPANPYNINLIQADSYNSGIGGINGQIHTTGLKSSLVDMITMLLMNEAGQAVTFSQVTDQGEFDFTGLDYGIYYLKAEMAGCQSDYIKVEITPDHPIVDVVMTLNGNQILGTREPVAVLDAGMVYPNPVRNEAQIAVKLNEGSQVYIELYNLSGQRVYQHTDYLHAGTTTVSVPVSHLRDGLFTLRIYTDSGLNLTRKLLKSQ